jgi:hypothetical protein
MLGTAEHASTSRAHHASPTCRVATFIGRPLRMNPVGAIDGKEVDREADPSERSDLVIHLGWDQLLRTPDEIDLHRRSSRHREPEATVVDMDSSPGAGADAVGPTEPSRQAVLVPLRSCAHQSCGGG